MHVTHPHIYTVTRARMDGLNTAMRHKRNKPEQPEQDISHDFQERLEMSKSVKLRYRVPLPHSWGVTRSDQERRSQCNCSGLTVSNQRPGACK